MARTTSSIECSGEPVYDSANIRTWSRICRLNHSNGWNSISLPYRKCVGLDEFYVGALQLEHVELVAHIRTGIQLEHAMRKWKAKLVHQGVQLGHGSRLTNGQWSMPACHKASPFWAQAVKAKTGLCTLVLHAI